MSSHIVAHFNMRTVLVDYFETVLLKMINHLSRCHWHFNISFPYHGYIIARNNTYVNTYTYCYVKIKHVKEKEYSEEEPERSPPKSGHDAAADGGQIRLDIGALSENRIQQTQWFF
jgi:hypothetical protein